MPKRFRFIGDPGNDGEGPPEIVMYGVSFNRTDWSEVSDAEAIRRLSNHTHFQSDNGSPIEQSLSVKRGAG